MNELLTEITHLVKGIDPIADAFSGTVRSDVVNMKNVGKARFLIHCGVGATGTSTITMEASDDAVPTNVTAIPFKYRQVLSGDTPGALTQATTAGFTTTAGSSKVIEVEVDASDMASTGYGYLSLKAVEVVDSPVLGGILIELYDLRYSRNTSTRATA